MFDNKILKWTLCFFAFSAILVSCTDEVDTIIEEEEVLETGMEVTIRGNSVSYDAYAAYCNENGVESFSVSNNLNLLDNDAWASDIAEGDFVIHYATTAEGSYSIAGAIIESTLSDGTVVKNFTNAVDDQSNPSALATIEVTTANDTEVVGSMSGDFLVLLDPANGDFEMVPFSATFVGEVDSSLTPLFCQ